MGKKKLTNVEKLQIANEWLAGYGAQLTMIPGNRVRYTAQSGRWEEYNLNDYTLRSKLRGIANWNQDQIIRP